MDTQNETPNSSQPLEERLRRKAEMDRLTEGRRKQLAVEHEQAEERERAKQTIRQQEQTSNQEEIDAARARAEGREEWRLNRHARLREADEARKRHEAERKEEKERKRKEEEIAQRHTAFLKDLYVRAMEQKRADLRERIKDQEKTEKESAERGYARSIEDINERKERGLRHLEAEHQHRLMEIDRETERARAQAAETRLEARKTAEKKEREVEVETRGAQDASEQDRKIRDARTQETDEKTRAESAYARAMLAIEERSQERRQNVDIAFARLKEEATTQAQRDTAIQQKRAQQKQTEAATRRTNAEQWLNEGAEGK